MGRRISGMPSWAFTAPSSNCTIEWMTDWGCTTTSIWLGWTPNSHLASITSKPLFIMEAESMVILAPISQLGCFRACALVTDFSCSRVQVRKGPPKRLVLLFLSGCRLLLPNTGKQPSVRNLRAKSVCGIVALID